MNNEEIFSKVFGKLTNLMETAGQWVKPWEVSYNPQVNLVTGKAYRGFNVISLSISRNVQGFSSSSWLSAKQIKDRGGKIKKGSKATGIIFYKMLEVDAPTEDDAERKRRIPMMRYSNVFNVDQTEGIEDIRKPKEMEDRTPKERIECAEEIWVNYEGKPTLEHGGDSAYYTPRADRIQMPEMDKFHSSEEYYSTLFHEVVHSTGHEKRLDRLDNSYFGDHSYSREELVAEIGSSFLRHLCGIEDERTDANSASYLKSWWKKLEKNPDDLRWASAKAQKAVDFVTGVEAVQEEQEKEATAV
jgi:antirestriction protein ArdC